MGSQVQDGTSHCGGWISGVGLLFWLTPGTLPETFLPLNRKAEELRVSAGEERGLSEQ